MNVEVVLIRLVEVVHIKQVAHSHLVIFLTALVSFLGSEDLSRIFNDKCARWDWLLGEKSPHGGCPYLSLDHCGLLDTLDEDLPFVFGVLLHEEVLAEVFVAVTRCVALVESERPVVGLRSPRLDRDHRLVNRVQALVVSRVDETLVVFVTWTFLGHLAAV